MPLPIGAKLGFYEVFAPISAGGLGLAQGTVREICRAGRSGWANQNRRGGLAKSNALRPGLQMRLDAKSQGFTLLQPALRSKGNAAI